MSGFSFNALYRKRLTLSRNKAPPHFFNILLTDRFQFTSNGTRLHQNAISSSHHHHHHHQHHHRRNNPALYHVDIGKMLLSLNANKKTRPSSCTLPTRGRLWSMCCLSMQVMVVCFIEQIQLNLFNVLFDASI